ncbi:carbohydrate ABC transporter permease [Phytoactinopolyspora halotolerans]|uniref:Carbohydrate ABC transporter permease n=1 Tax=Phytoactinopolyspora halotolerans TaxID=1981512 RepID=A0A6L9SDJ6_9ACTN|nr:carbohydrate ABC transporter permease [Phytoactinopolyspora halotolerans]NEE03336.1 carbohydrate ABC transporter permease [Phytoactinopolyspora halotolerans]
MKVQRGVWIVTVIAVVLFLTVWVFPIVWTLVTSVKLPKDVFTYPPSLIFEPTSANYEQVTAGRRSLVGDLWTSVVIAGSTTLLAMLVGLPLAYAFARLRLRWRNVLGVYTLFTYLIPRIGLVLPHFVILRWLNLTDTHLGLTLVYLSFTLPLAIWLMVSYCEDLPAELEEAARIDRATRLQAFWRIVLPQLRGGLAATTIFVFITAWNEFLFALALGGQNVRPVTVAMYNFISVEQTLWGPLTAAAVIAMLPVVVLGLLAQKQIVAGLTAGSVK